MSNKSGFTLIEVLIVVALMAVIGAIALPVSVDYQQRNDLDISQIAYVQAIRRAQQLSMSGELDSVWGVKLASGNVVVFKGDSYATPRDTSYDESFDISSSVIISGQSECAFAKVTGAPNTTGTTTLNNNNYQKTVSLNASGIVNY